MDPSRRKDDHAAQQTEPSELGRSGTAGTRKGSRDYILEAARKLFAERGFQGVSVRAIAKEAEVDPALVHYFYSAKSDVFSAAVGELCDTDDMLQRIRSAPADQAARRLVTVFLRMWETPGVREPLMAVTRSAVNNEEAKEVLADFLGCGLVAQAVTAMGAGDHDRRAALITAQLMGAVTMRYVMRIGPLADADFETLVSHLTTAVEYLLTTDLTIRTPRQARTLAG
jgi:AcrR family transcriptional regulator